MAKCEACSRCQHHLAPSAPSPANLLVDAGNDNKAAGSADGGRYYVARATSAMYVLDEDTDSDWGILPAGVKVVDGEYLYLAFKPTDPKRWYYPSNPPTKVKGAIPVEHLLHTAFEMECATDASTSHKRAVIAKGAVVLAECDHEQGMDALAQA